MRQYLNLKALCIMALPIIATSAWAEDWQEIGQNAEYKLFIAPSSVREVQHHPMQPTYQQAWFRFDIHQELSKDGLDVGDYKLRYYQIDCSQPAMGLVQGLDYQYPKNADTSNDEQQAVLVKETNPKSIEMKKVSPSSIGQALADSVCSGQFPAPNAEQTPPDVEQQPMRQGDLEIERSLQQLLD